MSDNADHWTPGAALIQAMTDDQFMVAWHEAVSSSDEEKIRLIEGNARHRFPTGDWRARYVSQHPEQTRYQKAT